jgi:hypothetical protein
MKTERGIIMFKLRKKVLATAMVACVACSMIAGASASSVQADVPASSLVLAENGGGLIAPFSALVASNTTTLAISNSGVATAVANLNGRPGVTTRVEITMTLQRRGFLGLTWSDVNTWSQTFNSHNGTLSRTHNAGSGTYRLRAVYVVSGGGSSETITVFSSIVNH